MMFSPERSLAPSKVIYLFISNSSDSTDWIVSQPHYIASSCVVNPPISLPRETHKHVYDFRLLSVENMYTNKADLIWAISLHVSSITGISMAKISWYGKTSASGHPYAYAIGGSD